MANLKIFVSSTCYDLNIVRGQLRSFINNVGYEPVMSDYNDVLYDPRDHTHESCVKEIQSADMVILIIGSRAAIIMSYFLFLSLLFLPFLIVPILVLIPN